MEILETKETKMNKRQRKEREYLHTFQDTTVGIKRELSHYNKISWMKQFDYKVSQMNSSVHLAFTDL